MNKWVTAIIAFSLLCLGAPIGAAIYRSTHRIPYTEYFGGNYTVEKIGEVVTPTGSKTLYRIHNLSTGDQYIGIEK